MVGGTDWMGRLDFMGGTDWMWRRYGWRRYGWRRYGWRRLDGAPIGWGGVKCEAIFFVVAKMSRRAIGGMLLNMLRFVIAAFLLAQFFHA